jgi:hypothetical protein
MNANTINDLKAKFLAIRANNAPLCWVETEAIEREVGEILSGFMIPGAGIAAWDDRKQEFMFSVRCGRSYLNRSVIELF